MIEYSLNTPTIRLSFKILDEDGNPDSGRSPTLTIEDQSDATKYVDAAAMTEQSTSAIYTLDWTHGRTTQTKLFGTFKVTGGGPPTTIISEFELKHISQDVLDDVDQREGNAI